MSYDKFTCKDCAERHLGCHDTCERYQKAKNQRIAEREELRKTDSIDKALRRIKFGRK